jgi:hypothetical protein
MKLPPPHRGLLADCGSRWCQLAGTSRAGRPAVANGPSARREIDRQGCASAINIATYHRRRHHVNMRTPQPILAGLTCDLRHQVMSVKCYQLQIMAT